MYKGRDILSLIKDQDDLGASDPASILNLQKESSSSQQDRPSTAGIKAVSDYIKRLQKEIDRPSMQFRVQTNLKANKATGLPVRRSRLIVADK